MITAYIFIEVKDYIQIKKNERWYITYFETQVNNKNIGNVMEVVFQGPIALQGQQPYPYQRLQRETNQRFQTFFISNVLSDELIQIYMSTTPDHIKQLNKNILHDEAKHAYAYRFNDEI